MRFFIAIFSLIFILSGQAALRARASQFDYDLGIRSEDLSFSVSRFIVGQKVRVYATVYNFGNKDIRGYVSFYQGAELLGDSQAISLRARGFAEEVFIDFTVPTGPFNILASIKGTDPADENSNNDQALTTLITPLMDEDSDGASDSEDNCPSVANSDQKDSDGDKIGDACDPDNDNDGLTNAEEKKLGTDPFNPDTDGDGISDNKDKSPLVFNKSPLAEPVAKPVAAKKEAGKKTAVVVEQKTETKSESKPVLKLASEEKNSAMPLKIVNTNFEKRDWGNYAFFAEAIGGQGGYKWMWDFGDGHGALGQNIIHQFSQPGDYAIKVSVKDEAGKSAQAEFSISVSFYSPSNPRFWLATGSLTAIAGTLLFVSWRPRRRNKFFIE